jgi:uncharacterized membrane protein
LINNWLFLLGVAEIKLSEKLAGLLFVLGLILSGVGFELYLYEVGLLMMDAAAFCWILGVGLLCWSVLKRFGICDFKIIGGGLILWGLYELYLTIIWHGTYTCEDSLYIDSAGNCIESALFNTIEEVAFTISIILFLIGGFLIYKAEKIGFYLILAVNLMPIVFYSITSPMVSESVLDVDFLIFYAVYGIIISLVAIVPFVLNKTRLLPSNEEE